jgi:putative phosphoribosyl transferase
VSAIPELQLVPRPLFSDRADAGDALARALREHAARRDVVVLGVGRSGAPVARHVADALRAPFGMIATQKIGVPGIPELPLAAIAEGSYAAVAHSAMWQIGVPSRVVEHLAARARMSLEHRARMYHDVCAPLPVARETVILVDDGLVTGVTMRAAARAIRRRRPRRIIVAVPVASYAGAARVRPDVDDIVTLTSLETLNGVSEFFARYEPVSDDDVLMLLRGGREALADRRVSDVMRDLSDRIASPWPRADDVDREQNLQVAIRDERLSATLGAPKRDPRGLVIFAQSTASSREVFRNRYIAGRARVDGYATMRLDLLTTQERHRPGDDASLRVDISRLVDRLITVCESARRDELPGHQRIVLAGTGVGAAVALHAASRLPDRVAGIVNFAGRVELAANELRNVRLPVLLLVGANDRITARRNAEAARSFGGHATLMRIPRAGHAFEEPAVLGVAAEHVTGWLERIERRGGR